MSRFSKFNDKLLILLILILVHNPHLNVSSVHSHHNRTTNVRHFMRNITEIRPFESKNSKRLCCKTRKTNDNTSKLADKLRDKSVTYRRQNRLAIIIIYYKIVHEVGAYMTDRHTVRTIKAVKESTIGLNTNTGYNVIYKIT